MTHTAVWPTGALGHHIAECSCQLDMMLPARQRGPPDHRLHMAAPATSTPSPPRCSPRPLQPGLHSGLSSSSTHTCPHIALLLSDAHTFEAAGLAHLCSPAQCTGQGYMEDHAMAQAKDTSRMRQWSVRVADGASMLASLTWG